MTQEEWEADQLRRKVILWAASRRGGRTER